METMKALVLRGMNEPLRMEEVPLPSLLEDEVLVRVSAAAFNRRDWWIQQGKYAGLKYPIILGSDGTGVVERLGSDRHREWLGKAVIINPANNWGNEQAYKSERFSILGLPEDGTFAQYVKVHVHNLYDMPGHLSFEEAAAVPLVGLTSYRALFSRAKLQKGEKVLVAGVGGGASSMALLWAKAAGAEVYVTSGSEEKIEKAKELGAAGGVNYRNEDWGKELKALAGGFDVILDSALGEGFATLLEVANPGGRIVFFGGTAGDLPPLNGRQIFWKQLNLLGTTMGSDADFRAMLDFLNEHQIKPVIDSVVDWEHGEAAMRKMDDSSQFGKIILKVW
jgi:zinc-binding alcohol dehydrogenase/oxidoreductase